VHGGKGDDRGIGMDETTNGDRFEPGMLRMDVTATAIYTITYAVPPGKRPRD
jgi:hypothetical protein